MTILGWAAGYAIFSGDEGKGGTIDPPPRQPDIQPPANWFVARWRKEMDKEADRLTRKLCRRTLKRNPEGARIEIHVWGQERQRAMMQSGWEPSMERGADMTLTLQVRP